VAVAVAGPGFSTSWQLMPDSSFGTQLEPMIAILRHPGPAFQRITGRRTVRAARLARRILQNSDIGAFTFLPRACLYQPDVENFSPRRRVGSMELKTQRMTRLAVRVGAAAAMAMTLLALALVASEVSAQAQQDGDRS